MIETQERDVVIPEVVQGSDNLISDWVVDSEGETYRMPQDRFRDIVEMLGLADFVEFTDHAVPEGEAVVVGPWRSQELQRQPSIVAQSREL